VQFVLNPFNDLSTLYKLMIIVRGSKGPTNGAIKNKIYLDATAHLLQYKLMKNIVIAYDL
jgi:hypothetical protein